MYQMRPPNLFKIIYTKNAQKITALRFKNIAVSVNLIYGSAFGPKEISNAYNYFTSAGIDCESEIFMKALKISFRRKLYTYSTTKNVFKGG